MTPEECAKQICGSHDLASKATSGAKEEFTLKYIKQLISDAEKGAGTARKVVDAVRVFRNVAGVDDTEYGDCRPETEQSADALFDALDEHDKNPLGVEGGCVCQSCGQAFREDVVLPDSLWNTIRPEGKPKDAGLLCGSCIGQRISQHVADVEKRAEGYKMALTHIHICDAPGKDCVRAWAKAALNLEFGEAVDTHKKGKENA